MRIRWFHISCDFGMFFSKSHGIYQRDNGGRNWRRSELNKQKRFSIHSFFARPKRDMHDLTEDRSLEGQTASFFFLLCQSDGSVSIFMEGNWSNLKLVKETHQG